MDTFAANVQGDRAEFGPTSLRRPIAFQASTVRSSQRTVPTVSFHDDFSAHVEGNEAADTCATAETVSQGATRQAGEYSVEFGRSNQGCQPSEEVEKNEGPRSRSERTLDESDLESQSVSLSRQNTATSSQLPAPRDPNLVSWESLDDPRNPKNWSLSRKWATVAIVSAFTFISSLASSMVAPTLPSISADLHITNSILSQMSLSMFVLAYAFGPLLLAPLSELYGRVPVLQLANLVFLVFNLACGFAQDSAQLLVCRFFAGLGGSAPLAVGGGVLGDCFTADQRGQAVALYSLMPLLGPAIGPICGGFIAEYSTWRWAFWSVSIADAVIQGLGVLFLQETWAPKLLAQKTERLRKETGNDALSPMVSNTQITFGKKMRQALARPFIMLFTQPIVVVLTIYRAFLYGLTYLVISTFTTLYTSPQYYGESASIAGLHYIALAIGFLLGAQLASAFNDWLYARLKKRNNGVGKPEFRAPVLIPCVVLLPAGFLWYGWGAQSNAPWIVPDLGVLALAAATMVGNVAMQAYTIDTYTKYAASAVAVTSFLRSLAGFAFPLFAPALYQSLGFGWGNSLMAFIAIAIGGPAPYIFWRHGAKLRARSKYAAGE